MAQVKNKKNIEDNFFEKIASSKITEKSKKILEKNCEDFNVIVSNYIENIDEKSSVHISLNKISYKVFRKILLENNLSVQETLNAFVEGVVEGNVNFTNFIKKIKTNKIKKLDKKFNNIQSDILYQKIEENEK